MRSPKISEENIHAYSLQEQEQFNKIWKKNHFNGFYLEIGSGNGQFMIELAKDNPDILILGCDLDFKRIKKTIKRIVRDDLRNCFVHLGRGENLLSWFSKKAIDHIYINFPDPWPKKRHHKHRFFYHEENLNCMVQKLKVSGRLYFVSDHEEYFFFALDERLKRHKSLSCSFKDGYASSLPNYYPTLYEEKFRAIGKKIFYTFFEKLV